MIWYDVLSKTPVGNVVVACGEDGLCGVVFDSANPDVELERRFPGEAFVRDTRHTADASRQLREYFRGDRVTFELDLDLTRIRTRFRRDVLRACAQVPFGETVSYGQLADLAGAPRAARAVGSTMAANPMPIVIPCHRVVSSTGLGGFTGDLGIKKTLLAHEHVEGFALSSASKR